jgi:hypothetical protein
MYYLSRRTKSIIVMAVIAAGGILYLSRRTKVVSRPLEAVVVARAAEKPAVTGGRQKSSETQVERDPFASPLEPSEEMGIVEDSLLEEEETGLILTGVVLRGKSSSAIVDRDIVRVGDVIGGKKIVVIEKGRVLLSDGRKRYVLYLRR